MKIEPQVVVALTGVAILVALGIRHASARRHPRYMCAYLANAARPEVQRAILAEFAATHQGINTIQPPIKGLHDAHGGSVFCPSCRADYPAGTLYCECCGIETNDMEEANTPTHTDEERSGQAEKLVVVHVAGSPTQASVLKMYLESHSIDCITRGHVPSSVYNFSISPLAEVQLLVRESDTVRARALLLECQ